MGIGWVIRHSVLERSDWSHLLRVGDQHEDIRLKLYVYMSYGISHIICKVDRS